jgi:NADPH-dependent 2,4-dienoyl-CoA reductase/sulfur reductase-like enzyme
VRSTKYLLIGGGLASSQAAKILAAKDPGAPITLVCREPHLPYDRPPLSKEFLRGEKTRDELPYDPDSFFHEKNIDVLLGESVVGLDTGAKTAALGSAETIRFEKALIATGGEPVRLDLPGSSLGGIHYLRSVDDALAIRAELTSSGRQATVIGAGFIGMELAASLTRLGVRVTVIEAASQIWARFLDATLAGHIRSYYESKGITFLTGESVREFKGDNRVRKAVTNSGREIACDFVCVGVGIRPEVRIAEGAGLAVQNGIVVNERLQTSHADIFAAGDAANYPDPIFGKRRRVEHWGFAEYTGQVAGLNMAGIEQKYDLLSYAWSDIFDLHIEFAGDESEHDRVLVRGTLDAASFTVLYLKSEVLRAYFAVNTDSREFPALQKLIRQKTPLYGRDVELTNPLFDLKSL